MNPHFSAKVQFFGSHYQIRLRLLKATKPDSEIADNNPTAIRHSTFTPVVASAAASFVDTGAEAGVVVGVSNCFVDASSDFKL